MRGRVAALLLGLAVAGCGSFWQLGEKVELLTGIEACYAGGEHAVYAGLLVPDPDFGTRIAGKGPVMWPVGYTAVRAAGGQVAVLNRDDKVVATTGREYALAPAPLQQEETASLIERLGAIPAPDCYPWDTVEVHPTPP